MSYKKQEFKSGDTLYASQLNAMDSQIDLLSKQATDEIHVGSTEPTDSNVKFWVNPYDETTQSIGLTVAQINALYDVITHIGSWTDSNAQTYIKNFETAFGITSSN